MTYLREVRLSRIDGTVSIYVLIDPRTDEVRYVGQTTDPAARLMGHISDNSMARRSKRYAWIVDLRAAGLIPRMFIVEEVAAADSNPVEQKWIEHYRAEGADLLNGKGFPRFNRGKVMGRRWMLTDA